MHLHHFNWLSFHWVLKFFVQPICAVANPRFWRSLRQVLMRFPEPTESQWTSGDSPFDFVHQSVRGPLEKRKKWKPNSKFATFSERDSPWSDDMTFSVLPMTDAGSLCRKLSHGPSRDDIRNAPSASIRLFVSLGGRLNWHSLPSQNVVETFNYCEKVQA
jgi:hypothetical protein